MYMKPEDSLFSAGKPKNIPWFFIPVLIGVTILVILYKWFN